MSFEVHFEPDIENNMCNLYFDAIDTTGPSTTMHNNLMEQVLIGLENHIAPLSRKECKIDRNRRNKNVPQYGSCWETTTWILQNIWNLGPKKPPKTDRLGLKFDTQTEGLGTNFVRRQFFAKFHEHSWMPLM